MPAAAGGSDAERWQAVPRALRAWALVHPHEWGLVFGAPVPGYEAPFDTVTPYARIAAALMRPVVEAKGAGRLRMDGPARPGPRPARRRGGPSPRGAACPDMPVETVVAAIQAWTTIIGAISLEVFGHWRNTVLNPGELFEAVTRDLAASLGLG